MNFPFATDRTTGLVNIESSIDLDPLPTPELASTSWSEVTFSDIEFRSSGSDPITVDFVLAYGSSRLGFSGLEGATFELQIDVELDGDLRSGISRATVLDRGISRDYSGFLAGGIPVTGIVTIEDFEVPVNVPLGLRFRLTHRVNAPAETMRAGRGFPAVGKQISGAATRA